MGSTLYETIIDNLMYLVQLDLMLFMKLVYFLDLWSLPRTNMAKLEKVFWGILQVQLSMNFVSNIDDKKSS